MEILDALILNNYSCPYCDGTMELRMDGYEYCDSCEYNTKNGMEN